MSRHNNNHNQYGNYYDPVGSQANQPTGYTHQASSASVSAYPSAAASSNYQSGNYTGYSSVYGQQYGTSGQSTRNSTSRAAAALSSLSSSDYTQPSGTHAANTSTYDSSSWNSTNYNTTSYPNANLQVPNRSASSQSPLYPSQASSSTFGRVTEQQGQSTSDSYSTQSYQGGRTSAVPSSQQSYQASYTQPTQTQQPQQPQRYNSPLHAVQAQQNQSYKAQSSRAPTHQAAPSTSSTVQQTSNRQQSASVEPSPTTVNPSQVYDDRAERQRKAQAEAEKRRKREAEEAARKAEEDRLAEEARKQEQKQKAEKEAAMKKAEQDRKAEERKKAREEKRQSKTAATALQKMASSGGSVDPVSIDDDGMPPPANAEEAEMRAMFKKMREFNARNPAMLAKLWEEERKSHAASQSPQPQAVPPSQSTPKPASAQEKAVAGPSNQQQVQQYRPFTRPPAPPAPPKSAAPAPNPAKKAATPVSTALWPPQKKGTLAEMAGRWLSSLPENVGKTVCRDDILKILEFNPSYVQLCEALEALGLRFERSLLARELLKAVPDGLRAQPHPPPTAPLSAVNGTAPQVNGARKDSPGSMKRRGRPPKDATNAPSVTSSKTVNYETPSSFPTLAEATSDLNKVNSTRVGGPVQAAPPLFGPEHGHNNGSRAPSQFLLPPPEHKPDVKPEAPPRPPANKEEAARKRTFGDLVDLTADDSDDEGPPPKLLQPPSGPVNGVVTQPSASSSFRQPNAPPSFRQPMSFKDFMHRPTQGMIPGQGPMHPSAPPAQMGAPPQTVTSNVPHTSTPQPQQQQQPPKPKPKGPTAEYLQLERIRGRMLVEPIMRDRVARKSKYDTRTIARDVLLATGRHPDMRALNAHLNSMQKLLGDHGGSYETDGTKGNRSDLSTIRWDIIDPSLPEKAKVNATVSDVPASTTRNAEEVDDADDEDDEPAASAASARPYHLQSVQHDDGTVSYVTSYDLGNNIKPAMPKKRRGRPPRNSTPIGVSLAGGQGQQQTPSFGQREKTSRPAGTPARPTSAGHGATPTTAPTRTTAPTAQPSGNTPPVGYSAFGQLDEHGKKKKGRPFGWRKAVHSRAAQGLAPAKPGSSSALPSRLRESQKPPSELQEPRYQVYKCRWQGCKAELHNLDTLKKHVVKVHGRPAEDEEWECHWQPCDGITSAEGGAGGKGKGRVTDLATFADIEGWMAHVYGLHLQPVAWELGDGPRGGVSDQYNTDSESAAYLSDAQGRSVTPVIHPFIEPLPAATSQVAPSGMRTGRVGRPPKGAMGKDERKAAAELRGLEEHKRAVGATIEKTGSTLANAKRRAGFFDDEDFEDEVVSEGEPGGDGEEEDEE